VVRGGWTKKMFIIGVVLDGLVAAVMLAPDLEALAWGFDEPVLDPGYRFAMNFGAALMVGWTALLVWAAAKPVERRAVAPLTMLVVAGLMYSEFLGMESGFLPAVRVWALLVFQIALLVGFALAFRAASER
jgi:hypothetical protein